MAQTIDFGSTAATAAGSNRTIPGIVDPCTIATYLGFATYIVVAIANFVHP